MLSSWTNGRKLWRIPTARMPPIWVITSGLKMNSWSSVESELKRLCVWLKTLIPTPKYRLWSWMKCKVDIPPYWSFVRKPVEDLANRIFTSLIGSCQKRRKNALFNLLKKVIVDISQQRKMYSLLMNRDDYLIPSERLEEEQTLCVTAC